MEVTGKDLMKWQRGKVVGDFRLEELFATGGMGAIWLGTQLGAGGRADLTRGVLIKTIIPDIADADGGRMREYFKREMALTYQFDYPSLIKVLAWGESEDGTLWFAIPYIRGGEDLGKTLKHAKRFPIPQVVYVLLEMADGLDYAHARGVVHRDLKPGNVMSTAEGKLIILDFGLGKRVAGSASVVHPTSHVIVGTPGFMAPEQYDPDAAVTLLIDLFALGAIGFQLATGRPPFYAEAETAHQLMAAYRWQTSMERVPHLWEHGVEMTPGLEAAIERLDAVIQRLLQKNPADRYHSAAEIRDDLRQLKAQMPDSHKIDSVGFREFKASLKTRAVPITGVAQAADQSDGVPVADMVDEPATPTATPVGGASQPPPAITPFAEYDSRIQPAQPRSPASAGSFARGQVATAAGKRPRERRSPSTRLITALGVGSAIVIGVVVGVVLVGRHGAPQGEVRSAATPSHPEAPTVAPSRSSVEPAPAQAPAVIAPAASAASSATPAPQARSIITLDVTPADAHVAVDGRSIEGSPPYRIEKDRGSSVVITVERDGYASFSRAISLTTDSVLLPVTLEPAPKATPPAPEPSKPVAKPRRREASSHAEPASDGTDSVRIKLPGEN